jgi:hypothetical protein
VRAISFQADEKEITWETAITPSSARLCHAEALRLELPLINNDINHKKRKALIICGTLRKHQLVNISARLAAVTNHPCSVALESGIEWRQ